MLIIGFAQVLAGKCQRTLHRNLSHSPAAQTRSMSHIDVQIVLNAVESARRVPCLQRNNVRAGRGIFYRSDHGRPGRCRDYFAVKVGLDCSDWLRII